MKLLTIGLSLYLGATVLAGEAPFKVLDPNLRVGVLENGMTYYVRVNHKPEDRAELRLVVNAGSILEDDDQLGFAHFVEHMAFNGTTNFAKNELVDYLESIGMRFGADLNAFTGFDMTAYLLQVPTDDEAILDKGLLILSDWAHQVSFDTDEVDKERGVVLEEWRRGKGAQERVMKQQFPVLFHNSRYADRLPIGKPEILEHGDPKALVRFYKDWYRPDLMAVVAVGDFDADQMEAKIIEKFSQVPAKKDPQERKEFDVPPHKEALFTIATDPELPISSVMVIYKNEPEHRETVQDARRELIQQMFFGMLNQRLSERARQSPPPFLFAQSAEASFVRGLGGFIEFAAVAPDKIESGMAALLEEGRRVQLHGFTQSELERQKQDQLRAIQKTYDERDKTQSANYASAYMNHFVNGGPIIGIDKRFALYQEWIPSVELQELNALVEKWIRDDSRVIAVSLPEKEGVDVPDKASLAAVFDRVSQESLEAYTDDVGAEPLMAKAPEAGEITSEAKLDEVDGVHWTLANGVEVFIKVTDFKNDEILFTASRDGGHSLAPNDHFQSASNADTIAEEGGLGSLSLVQLEKKLAGKVVGVTPVISDTSEGIRGSASPKDIETLFKLIHLTFTQPRRDEESFASLMDKLKTQVENRLAQPETRFRDKLIEILTQGHPRAMPPTLASIGEIDLDQAMDFYRSRFDNAYGMKFVFVGNIDLETFKPLVTTYLGSLPSKQFEPKYVDRGVRPPEGRVDEVVHAGVEPKSQVALVITDGLDSWNPKIKFDLDTAVGVLNILLREKLREEMGGVYSVFAYANVSHEPVPTYSISVAFSCDPDRVDELFTAALKQMADLRDNGPSEKNLAKIIETEKRGREVELKQNRYWMRALSFCISNDLPLDTIYQKDTWIEGLDAASIQKAAQTYLDESQLVKVVMQPNLANKAKMDEAAE